MIFWTCSFFDRQTAITLILEYGCVYLFIERAVDDTIFRGRGSIDLADEIVGAHDRTGHELRKEQNEEYELARLDRSRHRSAITVHHESDDLEGIEANGDRQYDLEAVVLHPVGAQVGDVRIAQEPAEAFGEKIKIFIEPENRKIQRHGQTQEQSILIGEQMLTDRVVDHDQKQKEQQEGNAIPGIEEQTGNNNQVLFPARGQRPVDDINKEKENEKDSGIE